MKLLVFSVFDVAVKAFGTPFYARTKGEALRGFSQACNNREHEFFKHAPDFQLFELGEFDDSTGFVVCQSPVRVIGALECLVGDEVVPLRSVKS